MWLALFLISQAVKVKGVRRVKVSILAQRL